MQVKLSEKHRLQPYAKDAEEILRRCVHCGFCNATCPTFQLLGDELDGPRGRIYLIKQILEGASPTPASRKHLDRCLSCQSCETTCPSGVRYTRLLETGRQMHDENLSRPIKDKWLRIALRKMLLQPVMFKALLTAGHSFSFLLPPAIKKKLPPLGKASPITAEISEQTKHTRTLLMLRGCAQQVCAPEINRTARDIFNQLGFNVIESPADKCCGALSQHNDATEEARELARKNIDAWWPLLEQGAESIVVTASGCATMVHDYGHLLADDLNYSDKARRVAELCRDPIEILEAFQKQLIKKTDLAANISYQAPCTQQHGLQLQGQVETLLSRAGFSLTQQNIGHLCCGSAGSYSVLQPVLSSQLKANKLQDLTKDAPGLIATANIGCLLHLQSGSDIPVKHWLQLIDVDRRER
ncbi:MAG: glycolate oxidase subunit GlcF [Pseudomonadota bacterium]|nr:glycolate oxidase subunit GlcF [Pseudomonadota bacterium]